MKKTETDIAGSPVADHYGDKGGVNLDAPPAAFTSEANVFEGGTER